MKIPLFSLGLLLTLVSSPAFAGQSTLLWDCSPSDPSTDTALQSVAIFASEPDAATGEHGLYAQVFLNVEYDDHGLEGYPVARRFTGMYRNRASFLVMGQGFFLGIRRVDPALKWQGGELSVVIPARDGNPAYLLRTSISCTR
jgi:hypothetical protein